MADDFVSIDVGGTTVRVARGRADGTVEQVVEFPTDSHGGPDDVLGRIAAQVDAVCGGGRPERVGIGLPGTVDPRTGVSHFLPNMPGNWRGVAVGETLRRRLGCEVRTLNDVRQHTMGELAFGHGRGRDRLTMIYVGIGTGIGGGIVIEGKLRLGPLGAAGEVGHMTILPSGPRCGCGNRGCLETLASGPALASAAIRLLDTGQAPELYRLVGGNADRVNGKTITEAAAAGDTSIREVIATSAEYLGLAMANLVTALHPDMIVIGGGVSLIGDMLFEPLRATVRDRVRMFGTDDIEIVPSRLGDDAGILGGLASAAFGTEA